jgi:hypothetical protein
MHCEGKMMEGSQGGTVGRENPGDGNDYLSAMVQLKGHIGSDLLAYLMGCDAESLSGIISGAAELSKPQADNADELSHLWIQILSQFDGNPPWNLIGGILTQVQDNGRTIAQEFHLRACGDEIIPVGDDEIEQSIIALALDAYPAFMLPLEPETFPRTSFHTPAMVAALVYRHPQGKRFADAVLRDSTLKRIFANEAPHFGHMAVVRTNTGHGGTVQLVMLPDLVLNAAWRHVGGRGCDPFSFANEALRELRLVMGVVRGETGTIAALLAFTGVLLPEGEIFEIDGGVVRAVADRDRQYAPESLRAQLRGTDPSGISTVINYDGDVLLEYRYPYRGSVRASVEDMPEEWPIGLWQPNILEAIAVRLRFSLMLAVERDPRAQLVQTWTFFDEPLANGIFWNDPRGGAGIVPTQLTSQELAAWREWYVRLSAAPVARIELALTRVLRAIAERREQSDVLIDSVIAWENIFGTKDGEPTFRVTTCFAKLLADSIEERIALRTRLGKIYALRSKVVHGSGNLKSEDFPLCQEALDFAIRVIKVLVAERTDILELPDGAARSARLLLGA